MKLARLTILLSCTVALSACGLFSKKSHSDQDEAKPKNPDSVQYDPDTLDKIRAGSITGKYTGNYIGGLEDGKKGTVPVVLSGDNLNTITIGGETITLVPEGVSADKFYRSKNPQSYQVIGTNLFYARYGYIERGADKPVYVFTQGLATKDMPASGSATYQGKAFFANRKGFDTTGDATFDVDFYNKHLRGSISGEGFPPLLIAAQIEGNSFEGNFKNITTRGNFYGPEAEELSGTYLSDDKSFGGAFGATRK